MEKNLTEKIRDLENAITMAKKADAKAANETANERHERRWATNHKIAQLSSELDELKMIQDHKPMLCPHCGQDFWSIWRSNRTGRFECACGKKITVKRVE